MLAVGVEIADGKVFLTESREINRPLRGVTQLLHGATRRADHHGSASIP